LVPESIRELPCFLDRLTGIWRYDYGEAIEIGDRKVIAYSNAKMSLKSKFDSNTR
jgi:hypothetical protein